MRENLLKAGDAVIIKIEDLKMAVEQREEERVFYDHYRNKVAKMEKAGGESTSANQDDQEKYTRNQTKLDTTSAKFEQLTEKMTQLLEKLEERCERLIVDLTLRFSKELQLGMFIEFRKSY